MCGIQNRVPSLKSLTDLYRAVDMTFVFCCRSSLIHERRPSVVRPISSSSSCPVPQAHRDAGLGLRVLHAQQLRRTWGRTRVSQMCLGPTSTPRSLLPHLGCVGLR